MCRVVLSLAVLMLVIARPVDRAAAYETWCADDPVIAVGGRVADIQVQMPVSELLSMRSTALTVIVPRNVSGVVLVDDLSAYPMTTTIAPIGAPWDGAGAIPITVVVNVSAATDYPIRVVITPASNPAAPAMATGTANSTLRLSVPLG